VPGPDPIGWQAVCMDDPRIAMATGAGSGVGRAASVALATDGWIVVAVGRNVERLDETMEAVTAAAKADLTPAATAPA